MAIFNKERIAEQLRNDEGFRPKAYWDNKQWSIGYGTRAKSKDEVITKDKAAKRMEGHIKDAETGFDILFKGHEDKFNEVRTEAMMNIIYNIGLGSMLGFKNTLDTIRNNKEVNWNEVALHLKDSKWYHQVGDRAKRLIKEIQTGEKA